MTIAYKVNLLDLSLITDELAQIDYLYLMTLVYFFSKQTILLMTCCRLVIIVYTRRCLKKKELLCEVVIN